MFRRSLLSLLLLPLARNARAANAWSLVSADEVERDRSAPRKALTRGLALPNAPQIQVLTPEESARLPHPFSVHAKFIPAPDATIVVSSFRATYGWLEIDITDRLLQHARVTADGVAAEDVDAPSGEHRVNVSIADSLGRVGHRSFRFTIA